MSQRLINLNPDLRRLQEEGYEIEVRDGYALLHNVPYVNTNRVVRFGTLISNLELAGDVTIKPQDHVMHFHGELPCTINGTILTGIHLSSADQILAEGITIQHTFSNRPPNGYDDYYHKFTRYMEIITPHARDIDPSASAQAFLPAASEEDSPFLYYDTNTSRANISVVTRKLKGQKIAIIGVGGTGSYILDLVAKTPVSEIHLYDKDSFLTHNAFRSPGAPAIETLREVKRKANYFADIYQHMHKGIVPHDGFITEHNVHQLLEYDFLFVSLDHGASRKIVHHYLMSNKKPFIDVGIAVRLIDESLLGQIRTTTGLPDHYVHFANRVSYGDDNDNDYDKNIQIAELNALNASLAVIKWKQINGFYQERRQDINSVYVIDLGGLSHVYKED